MSRIVSLGALALFIALALTGCQAQCPVPAPVSEPNPAEQTTANESPPIDLGGAVKLSDLQAMALYENLAYGFNISYPEEWVAHEPDPNDKGIVVGFLAPGEDPNSAQDYLTVQIQSLPADQKITLEQYTQSVISSLKSSYPDFALLAQANMVLSNQPGNVMVYTVTSEKTLYQIMLAETIKENKAYIITYYALADRYSEFENDAKRMINSFELIQFFKKWMNLISFI